MYGAAEFYFTAHKEGLKPVIGLEIPLFGTFTKSSKDMHSLVLLAKNYKGYQELSHIVSFAHKKNQVEGHPRATLDVIRDKSQNLIALTGGKDGILAQTFACEGEGKALERLKILKTIFGEDPVSYTHLTLPTTSRV